MKFFKVNMIVIFIVGVCFFSVWADDTGWKKIGETKGIVGYTRPTPKSSVDEMKGVGIIEAPRGTLTHHYITDERGVIKKANLIVATLNNSAAVNMSVNKAARSLIKPGTEITEGLLNRIEMAWRPYDLCLACATHSLNGPSPVIIYVYDSQRNLVKKLGGD